jgi:hypothetical protein
MWRQILRDAYAAHPLLIRFAAACAVFAAVTAAAGLLDARTITGAPAWNKPFKFFVSAGIYAATFAWYLALVNDGPRRDRPGRHVRIGVLAGHGIVVALTIELVLISMQAWRGVSSHFNRTTTFDGVVFDVMGGAIFALSVLHAVLIVVLLRTRGAGRPLVSAARWGAAITFVGLAVGGLMVAPSSAQLAALQRHDGRGVQGAHTVGVPDGGPGLPLVNWSTEGGDRRAPHFVGLHAMQAVPLVALLAPARWPMHAVLTAVRVSGTAYAMLTIVMIVQATQARPVIRPGMLLGGILVATAVGWIAAMIGLARGVDGDRRSAER